MASELLLSDDVQVEENASEVFVSQEQNDNTRSSTPSINKRKREEWVEVRKRNKRKEINNNLEIYVICKEVFPKQFALAKLLHSENICNITNVKYLNPYKISIEFNCESSAQQFISNKHLQELGWTFQRPMEVGLSYGVIKNIELSLSNEELSQALFAGNYTVANIKRLKQRKREETGWEDSEAVRIGFKGPELPPYIYIFGLRIKVEPYNFPVTQCSKCWRYGHTIKFCPSKRIYCPKCGGKHANCETTRPKCLNCTNNHIALDRNCPVYLREKKIREIMKEFNVTYRKAVTMYIPPELPSEKPNIPTYNSISSSRYFDSALPVDEIPTFAEVASTSYTTNKNQTSKSIWQREKKKKRNRESDLDKVYSENETTSEVYHGYVDTEQRKKIFRHKRSDSLSFSKLILKLKNIIFHNSNESWQDRAEKAIHLCIEWLNNCIKSYISNMPFLKFLFD